MRYRLDDRLNDRRHETIDAAGYGSTLQNFITKPTLQSDSVIDPINIIKDMGLMCYTPVKSIPFSVVARSLTTLLQFFLTLYPQNSQTSSSYLSNEANTELPLSFSPFYTARPKHKLFF
jgi:hypothetical protein